MSEKFFGGDSVAPELLDIALAENRYFDADIDGNPEATLLARNEVLAAEKVRNAAETEALRQLSQDETLVGDDLIKAYGDILSRFGDMYKLRHLEAMCELSDKLVPGEVFFAYDGSVMKVAAPQPESENRVVFPKVSVSPDSTFGPQCRFAWRVLVEGISQGVIIDNPTIAIGREEVRQELDLFHVRYSDSIEGILAVADDYDTVGATYQSETYRLVAASNAVDQLGRGRFMPDRNIAKIIKSVSEGGAFEVFIDELSERLIREDPRVTDFHYVRIVRAIVMHERGQVTSAKQVFNRYLQLEKIGKQRRDQREA